MEFIAYKSNETYENRYFQIPQELFTNKFYKDKLNSDSKLLYAFLLDRLTLSSKNEWYDENGNVYLIFTRKEVEERLNLSDKTVTKAFKQLEDVKLIYEKRQGMGKTNLIYVGKINHEENYEKENSQNENRKNYDSRVENSTIQEPEILRGINTNNINPNNNHPQSEEEIITIDEIKDKSKLNEFNKEERCVLEDVIDRLYNTLILKVGNVEVDNLKIKDKLKLINKDNLIQLVNIYRKSSGIKNMTQYLVSCLYNNLGNVNISKSAPIKKITNQIIGRKYSDEFLESFYM